MKIQVAGPGCLKCHQTLQNVINACAELNLAADISFISDIQEYSKLGVMLTPAVIINNKIVVSGRVPSVKELKKIISQYI